MGDRAGGALVGVGNVDGVTLGRATAPADRALASKSLAVKLQMGHRTSARGWPKAAVSSAKHDACMRWPQAIDTALSLDLSKAEESFSTTHHQRPPPSATNITN